MWRDLVEHFQRKSTRCHWRGFVGWNQDELERELARWLSIARLVWHCERLCRSWEQARRSQRRMMRSGRVRNWIKFEIFKLKFTVKTQLNLIKEPEQKVSIPSRLLTIKTWWGNCPSTATWPPTICGKISISVLKFKLSMNLWRFLKFAEIISQKTLENVQKTMKNCKNFMFDRGKLFNDWTPSKIDAKSIDKVFFSMSDKRN